MGGAAVRRGSACPQLTLLLGGRDQLCAATSTRDGADVHSRPCRASSSTARPVTQRTPCRSAPHPPRRDSPGCSTCSPSTSSSAAPRRAASSSRERALQVAECRSAAAHRRLALVRGRRRDRTTGPLTAEQADWVAVLVAGDGAVLGAVSAMRAAGVRRRPARPAPGRRPRAAPRAALGRCSTARRSRLLGPDGGAPAPAAPGPAAPRGRRWTPPACSADRTPSGPWSAHPSSSGSSGSRAARRPGPARPAPGSRAGPAHSGRARDRGPDRARAGVPAAGPHRRAAGAGPPGHAGRPRRTPLPRRGLGRVRRARGDRRPVAHVGRAVGGRPRAVERARDRPGGAAPALPRPPPDRGPGRRAGPAAARPAAGGWRG